MLERICLVGEQGACETFIWLIIRVDLAVSSESDRLASSDGFKVLELLRGQSNTKLVQASIRDLEDFHLEVADRVHVGFAKVVLRDRKQCLTTNCVGQVSEPALEHQLVVSIDHQETLVLSGQVNSLLLTSGFARLLPDAQVLKKRLEIHFCTLLIAIVKAA